MPFTDPNGINLLRRQRCIRFNNKFRGCLNLAFALTLYLATYFGSQVAAGVGSVARYRLFLGLPILLIVSFTDARIL